jgi:hypothetical protein
MNYKIRKTAEQLANEYFPEGDKGPQLGGNADQESEVSEEINEDMEARDQENYQPGKDNMIVDKMDSVPINEGTILAELEKLVILVKSSYARDLIRATITKLGRNLGD